MASDEGQATMADEVERFRAIAEFTYDWESWIGSSGRVSWVNSAVERITGYTSEECLAFDDYPLPLVHPLDRELVRAVAREAEAGSCGNHVEFRVQRKNGTIRWVAISWQPVVSPGGDALGYRTSVRDIQDRKEVELALELAVERAEAANRAKSEFLANVSHELRTPLQSIMGYAELLALGRGSLSPEAAGKIILEQGRSLDRLVGQLLDFSSLQGKRRPVQSQEFDPQELLRSVVESFLPLAEKRGLSLTLTEGRSDRSMRSDPDKIRQVLANLIGNALKFTKLGSVEVSTAQEADGLWSVVVDDSGPGVSEKESIFLPFQQGEAASALGTQHKPEGVGLGLAISRQLCRHLGGDVICKSSPLGGARFIATFSPHSRAQSSDAPLGMARHEEVTFPKQDDHVSSLLTLVIDDVASSREYVREALLSLGHRCTLASTAVAGVELAKELLPEVVFVDLQMPQIDGFETAKQLRKTLGQVPVLVAMSAARPAGIEGRLRESGFSQFAGKPLGLEELSRILAFAQRQLKEAAATDLAPAGFSEQRFQELAGIRTERGTLLERMVVRVLEELPRARRELEQLARASSDEPRLAARTVHELGGLFALIGATRAHASSAHLEEILTRSESTEGIAQNAGELSALIQEARQVEESLRRFRRL